MSHLLASPNRDICLALTPLMKRATQRLAHLDHDLHGATWPKAASQAENSFGGPCAIGTVQRQLERAAQDEVVRRVANRSPEAVNSVPSLCLPHLRNLVTSDANDVHGAARAVWIQALARQLAPAVDRLTEDLQRYVLRRDAIRHGLASDEETQAAKRALSFLAGNRAFPPQP